MLEADMCRNIPATIPVTSICNTDSDYSGTRKQILAKSKGKVIPLQARCGPEGG